MIPNKALYKIVSTFVPDFKDNYSPSYETRLQVQKIVYLFDQLRGKNSYGFSWYLAGPYSSTLTRQVYDSLLVEVKDDWNKLELSDFANMYVEQLSDLIRKAKEQNSELSDSRLYELLASILYIKNTYFANDFEDEMLASIKDKLLINKPHFTETQNLDAIIQLVINLESKTE